MYEVYIQLMGVNSSRLFREREAAFASFYLSLNDAEGARNSHHKVRLELRDVMEERTLLVYDQAGIVDGR